jgi:putative phosphoesterase
MARGKDRGALAANVVVGIISDTHGLMRPEAITALNGSDLIIHAGDVGKPEVIDQLNAIAPTHAVRGNVDTQSWARTLPDARVVEAGGLHLFVLHVRAELVEDPVIAGYAAVIFGHSHTPSIETRSGVLWLNPGSAGPRRFRLPVSVARMRVSGRKIEPVIVELDV